MHEPPPRPPSIAIELALLLTLATLWGASYSFIKIGVATIPPITLIAVRTLSQACCCSSSCAGAV